MTGNTDLIENLEEFTKVHHGILDAAMSIGDLSQMYGELLAYAGFVEARYPTYVGERIIPPQMTEAQIEEYHNAYRQEEDRKDWG